MMGSEAVLPLCALSVSTSQYPLLTSYVEEIAALPKTSMHSPIQGIGFDSRLATTLNLQKTTQKRTVLSFFGAEIIGAAHSACARFTILRQQLFRLDFLELFASRPSTVWRRLNSLCRLIDKADTMSCYAYATRVSISFR